MAVTWKRILTEDDLVDGGTSTKWKISAAETIVVNDFVEYNIASGTIQNEGTIVLGEGAVLRAGDISGEGTVQDVSAAWPVGSVFFSVVNTNPATLLGFGTWARIGEGKLFAGFKSGDADFGTIEGTGGAATADLSHTHTLSAHTHTIAHTHNIAHTHGTGGASAGATQRGSTASTLTLANHTHSTTSQNTSDSGAVSSNATGVPSTDATASGGSGTQSILPPYITLVAWKRTA